MLPFFSLPSTTSDQRWSGVAGLRRLFGSKAFSKIENAERERIKQLMKTCLPDGGIALCFQSTAYNCLVNSEKTEFKLANAYESKLITEIEGRVIVAGSMPTRFLIGRRAQAALQKTIEIAEKSYANLR